jgi:hypothetical protein
MSYGLLSELKVGLAHDYIRMDHTKSGVLSQ